MNRWSRLLNLYLRRYKYQIYPFLIVTQGGQDEKRPLGFGAGAEVEKKVENRRPRPGNRMDATEDRAAERWC